MPVSDTQSPDEKFLKSVELFPDLFDALALGCTPGEEVPVVPISLLQIAYTMQENGGIFDEKKILKIVKQANAGYKKYRVLNMNPSYGIFETDPKPRSQRKLAEDNPSIAAINSKQGIENLMNHWKTLQRQCKVATARAIYRFNEMSTDNSPF